MGVGQSRLMDRHGRSAGVKLQVEVGSLVNLVKVFR